MKKADRKLALMPNGIPRYVRCYDNQGETLDRYTVVFTKIGKKLGYHPFLGMNSQPFQGIGQHGESQTLIDWPTYGHLGRKIQFQELPKDCQTAVLDDYKDYWGI